MFTFIGFLSLVTAVYCLGREATLVEIEYKCRENKRVELSVSEYECRKKLRTLDWVKSD